MLNIGKIEEGFVLDHIQAGKSMQIYKHLGLDKLDSTVAIIKNARSKVMGKKDILSFKNDIGYNYRHSVDMTSVAGMSESQENSLKEANQLLKQYSQEEKRTRLRIKAQRNFFEVLAVGAIIYACCK